MVSHAVAQPPVPGVVNREYAIKAAYLYNFGRYVTWPVEKFLDDRSPVVIGVLGPDPFGAALDRIVQRGGNAAGEVLRQLSLPLQAAARERERALHGLAEPRAVEEIDLPLAHLPVDAEGEERGKQRQ